MRIISGTHRGRVINVQSGLNIRPTTDKAKEALFNIINNYFDYTEIDVLDLFSGSGSMSYEFASRGAKKVTSVEMNFKCQKFIKDTAEKFDFKTVKSIKADAFSFLTKTNNTYDIIFADPPYDHEKIASLPDIIFENKLLDSKGWLIIEHPQTISFEEHPNFYDHRNYSKVNFSIFVCSKNNE